MFDHEQRVGVEVAARLDELIRVNSAGVLTQTSRNDLEAAIRRAGRQNRSDAQPAAMQAADIHTERMQRVSLDLFTEQIEGLTDDPERAAEMRRIASEADIGPMAEAVGERQAELVESIREEATEKLIAKVIAAAETSGDLEARAARVLVQIDDVWSMTRDRADRVAAWESESMNTEFAQVYNLANRIGSYRWVDMDDDKVRPLHRARDGQIFEWANPPDDEPYDGHPGVPPNCRCKAEPILT